MPSIVAQKDPEVAEKTVTNSTQQSAIKDLTAKDAKDAKKFQVGSVAFALFATFAVSGIG